MPVTKKEKPRKTPLLKRGATRDCVALALLLGLMILLLYEPLVTDRVLLSFDSRIWPPFSAKAPPELDTAPANMIFSDLPCWMVPERLVSTKMMNEGTPPLWTPYTLCGMPLLAGLAYPVHYPINFILGDTLGIKPLSSLAIQTLLNLFIAGMGMYFFLGALSLSRPSRLFGAAVLCASAWYITHIYIPIFINAAAWIPFMFWAGERVARRKAFGLATMMLAIFTGASFLGGFPQVTLAGLYGAGFWTAARALFYRDGEQAYMARLLPVAAFVLAVCVGTGLSTKELLPAAELKTNSMRDQDYPLSHYKCTALETPALLGQAVPGLFGHPTDPDGGGGRFGNHKEFLFYRLFLSYHVQNNFMENALYIGTLPLLLALAALARAWRRSPVLIFTALSCFVLLTVLGTPLLDFIYHCLPGMRVGSPRRLLILHTLAAAGLAAFGLELLFIRKDKPLKRAWAAVPTGFGAVAAAVLAFGFPTILDMCGSWFDELARARGVKPPSHEELVAAFSYLRRLLWPPVIALLVFGVLRFFKAAAPKTPWPAFIVVVLAGVELFLFGSGFITTQAGAGQYPSTKTTDYILEQGADAGPFRTASFGRDELLVPNMAAVHGIQCLGGVSGLVLRRFGEYCLALDPGLINREDPRYVAALKRPESLASPLLDLLGVRYIAVGCVEDARQLERKGFSQAFRSDEEGLALFENPEALPRAFVVTSCVVTMDENGDENRAREKAMQKISAGAFDPSAQVVLEAFPSDGFSPLADPTGASPSVSIESYEPLDVILKVKMHEARGFLVLTDCWYPGWEAWVDGKKQPVLRADYAFRAVPLEEGAHTVRFRYAPSSRAMGTALAWTSLLLIIVFGCWLFWKHKTGPSPFNTF